MKIKKMPLRRCVGCREMKDKKILIRVILTIEGTPVIDSGGKSPGRGAYLCRDMACIAKAQKSRGLERSFIKTWKRAGEVYKQLTAEVER